MTIVIQPGYTLPEGKYARILHNGNSHDINAITGPESSIDFAPSNLLYGDTVDKWVPFSNLFASPASQADGTLLNITLGADEQTITDTASGNDHSLLFDRPDAATDQNVFAVLVETKTAYGIRLRLRDDPNLAARIIFDFVNETTITVGSGVGTITRIKADQYLCVYYPPPPVAGITGYAIDLVDNNYDPDFLGDETHSVRVLAKYESTGSATLQFSTLGPKPATALALAAHNLGSSGTQLAVQYLPVGSGVWTTLADFTPLDNSPIMVLFAETVAADWRLVLTGGLLPSIGVLKLGNALVMERPFYSGASPAVMNRNTSVLGNLSGSGDLLGRSVRRSTLSGSYSWSNLTYDWVRANLDGKLGLIQSVEQEPLFVAWRPSVTQDVDYIMEANVGKPSAQGTRNLWSFELSGEAHSYE